MKQTFSKTVTDRIQHNLLRNKLFEILALFTKIHAEIKAERIETKKPNKIPSLVDLFRQQIDLEACPRTVFLPLQLFAQRTGSFFFGDNWLGTIIV